MASRFHSGRHAGVLVPIFSAPSRRSWGIGEIPDLAHLAAWLSRAGLDFIQLLPINDMDTAHNSPYAARSAMAIEPLFVALDGQPDFAAAGGEAALAPEAREALAEARAARAVRYAAVRTAKTAALHLAFDWFDAHRGEHTDAFHAFQARESWWLDEYTLFLALHDEHGGRYWLEWEDGVRDRRPDALAAARARLAGEIRYHGYVQWVADVQWRQLREACGGVGLFGDFPFMVSAHSADVWSRQHEFRVDASVGAPPDAFSPTGQDWGLPAYRWDVIAAGGHEWLRQRAARCAALYDGFRVDHLVGFYRTFVLERDGRSAFVPPDEPGQLQQGETLMRLFAEPGARIVAEDLGTVPDFVRESMARLGVPGLKVMRWERQWEEPGQPFRDPASYPSESVAISGTHDTETVAEWWDAAGMDERRQVAALPTMRHVGLDPEAPFSPAVRDALLRALFSAASQLVILPVQDVFGWRDRINQPGGDAADNWNWRLPWPVEDLSTEPEAAERAAFLRSLLP